MKYSLLETVADLAYLAGVSKIYSGDSRADIAFLIQMAKEFNSQNDDFKNWDDYVLKIESFAKLRLPFDEPQKSIEGRTPMLFNK